MSLEVSCGVPFPFIRINWAKLSGGGVSSRATTRIGFLLSIHADIALPSSKCTHGASLQCFDQKIVK